MLTSESKNITGYARYFLDPSNATHRQYEALRAYFVDGLSSKEAARRFGYSEGSFRVLVYHFRQNPDRQFFVPPAKGPQKAPKTDPLRNEVVKLRKQNLSIYDICTVLEPMGHTISPVSVSKILKEEGFARLPRRRDDERPSTLKPSVAEVADVRCFDVAPRKVHTKFGGLFLFLPLLALIPLDRIVEEAGFPGSRMVPAAHAMRSLLGLKLFGSARHSHVMSYVLDEGLALFAGLNAIPKRAFMTEYSCRIKPRCHPLFMKKWFDAAASLGLEQGTSFDLDFHTIPFHGEDALIEKHYVSKRSRRQKGLLAFLAQDAATRVFCYGNADVAKEDQNDEILRFVDYWTGRTGNPPEELIFDSKLTTYANLNQLNRGGIRFMTLRRRSRKMVAEILSLPVSAWHRIELKGVSRTYKTPRIIDEKVTVPGYEGRLRQIVITDLGHEQPTFLLTNHLRTSPNRLIERYAQRMIIENNIADGIDFFHMDALSSAVAMKVNLDLQLTLMASSLYRLFAQRIGHRYATAKSRHIFRDFIDATAQIVIRKKDVVVRFQKRAHNPLMLDAGFHETDVVVPWWEGKRLRLEFG